MGEHSADAANLLQQVGLENASEKKVKNFSMGMKQRLGIAQALLSDPDYLVLDEPFNGLDVDIKQHILELIQRLRDEGKGILVSTHLLEDIEALADDFVILDRGNVFLAGNLASFQAKGQVATFFFEEAFQNPGIAGNVVAESDKQISIQTDKKGASEILELLVAKGQVPYKIEWSGVLRDNYLKILDRCD